MAVKLDFFDYQFMFELISFFLKSDGSIEWKTFKEVIWGFVKQWFSPFPNKIKHIIKHIHIINNAQAWQAKK